MAQSLHSPFTMNTISIFAISVFLLTQTKDHDEFAIYACQRTTEFGVNDQCEPVKIIEVLPERARVYSFSSKTVKVFSESQLFKAEPILQTESIATGSALLVPSQLLNNSSEKKHRSICQVNGSAQHKFFELDCGGSNLKLIRSNEILKLKPAFGASKISKNYQSKK